MLVHHHTDKSTKSSSKSRHRRSRFAEGLSSFSNEEHLIMPLRIVADFKSALTVVVQLALLQKKFVKSMAILNSRLTISEKTACNKSSWPVE